METTNETVAPVHYNPNQLVTYKVIDGEAISFPTEKVTEIEYALDRGRYWRKQYDQLGNNVARLENDLEQYLDMDAEDIVAAICEIFGFTPTKEIDFEATVKITGTVSVPLAELSDFDINDIDLTVDASSYSHNIETDVEVEYLNTV